MRVILTPIRTPVANAYAERFARTIRHECLDWILIRSERHLARVASRYVEHYNSERPTAASGYSLPTRPHGSSQDQSSATTASAA
jgi:putative transposase